jgi:hypothetical protein
MMHSGLYGKSRRHALAEGNFYFTLSNIRPHGQKTDIRARIPGRTQHTVVQYATA